MEQARPDRGVGGLPGGLGLTELVAVLGGGGDATPGNLHVLAAGPAVELVQPQLLAAHIVPSPRLVLHVDAEVHVLLSRQHLGGERGDSEPPWKPRPLCAGASSQQRARASVTPALGQALAHARNCPVVVAPSLRHG